VSLGLSDEEASTLNSQYYTQYGLALRGLQRHHGVGNASFSLSNRDLLTPCRPDPMEFNEKCDGSLPLEEMLKPNPLVRRLLQDIDRSNVVCGP
jgi:pyrimidine and pyridine-specific 5'-nucleotidase